MSLRVKTQVLIAVVFGSLLLCLSVLFSTLLLRDAHEIELAEATLDTERTIEALQAIRKQLNATTRDWAHWDDTYDYVKTKNKKHEKSWFVYEPLAALSLSHVAIYDSSGATVLAVQANAEEETVGKSSDDFSNEMYSQAVRDDALVDPNGYTGFVNVLGERFLVAVVPILDTRKTLPPRGLLVLARPAGDKFWTTIKERTRQNLDYFHPESPTPLPSSLTKWRELDSTKPAIQIVDDDKLASSIVINDVKNNPTLLLLISIERHSFRKLSETRSLVLLVLLVGGLIAAAVIDVLVKRLVLSPLGLLGSQVNSIAGSGNSRMRISGIEGKDEIGKLSANFNTMLESLDQAQQAVENASRAKSNFVAKVSHELRTPIHGILGLLRIIKKNVSDDSARTQLGMVRDSTVGLLGVVNDILDFSKAEVGNLSVSPVPMKLRETVRSALRVIAPRVFERAESDLIECVASVDPTIPDELIGDSKRIAQLLVNLLSNAVKFTKRGAVTLTVRRGAESPHGEMIEFSVTDTGIGIPSDKLELVFEPFKQADDSVSRQYSGTGLGLAIVKQLVEMMHGKVSVTSEVGKGSTFTISIPLQYVGASTVAQEPLNSTYVWIINNAAKETELIGRALKQVRVNAWCASTDTLIGDKSRTPALSAVECLIVAGNTLVSPETWKIIQSMASLRNPDRIFATLSPHELSFREKLLAIGVSKIILTPLIAEDVLDVIRGQYKENYAGYDDYLEDEKPLQKSGLTMLVADDIITNQIVLRSMLQKFGHEVVVVSNGKEALDALGHQLGLRAQTPQDKSLDMVFMDVQMPVMDGLEAIRRIRGEEKSLGREGKALLPILAVTAHAFTEEHIKMIDAGADGVLSKPIEDRDLLRLIEHHQRASRSASQSLSTSVPESTFPLTNPGINAITHILDTLETLDAQIAKTCGLLNTTGGHTFVDAKKLQRRADNNLDLCRELLSSFQSTASDMLEELHSLVNTQNIDALEKAAHTLKGSLGEMGCEQGSKLAAEIVDLCRSKQNTEALAKLSDLLPIVESTGTVLSGALADFDSVAV